jgi:hypothetical protein
MKQRKRSLEELVSELHRRGIDVQLTIPAVGLATADALLNGEIVGEKAETIELALRRLVEAIEEDYDEHD